MNHFVPTLAWHNALARVQSTDVGQNPRRRKSRHILNPALYPVPLGYPKISVTNSNSSESSEPSPANPSRVPSESPLLLLIVNLISRTQPQPHLHPSPHLGILIQNATTPTSYHTAAIRHPFPPRVEAWYFVRKPPCTHTPISVPLLFIRWQLRIVKRVPRCLGTSVRDTPCCDELAFIQTCGIALVAMNCAMTMISLIYLHHTVA